MRLFRNAILALAAVLAATTAHAQIAFRGAASAGVAAGAATVITHVNAGNVATNDGGCPRSVSPAIPGGVNGDLLITLVNSREDSSAIAASGTWTQLYAATYGGGGQEFEVYIYYRFATGADAFTFTQSGSCGSLAARVSRFRGVDPTAPFYNVPIPGGNVVQQNANNVDTGTETTTDPDAMLLVASFINDDNFICEPGGWNVSFETQSNLNRDLSLNLHYQLQTTAGAKSIANWSIDANNNACPSPDTDENFGIIFALRPAPLGLTINVPAGTVAGDVMVAAIAVRPSSVSITAPMGWAAQAAALQNAAGNSSRQQIFYRVAGGAEPASYTWLFDSAHTGAVGGIVSYSGVDPAAPFNAFGGNLTPQGGDTNLQHRALAVTTTVADAMVISTHSFTSSATWTEPSGMTERVDVFSEAAPSAVGIALEMNSVLQPVAGSTGDKVAVAAGNGDTGSATLMALRPLVVLPVLHFAMDALSWNGTAGEVLDSSGNGLHGVSRNGANTAFVTPAIAGSPGTCRYGTLDGTNQYLETADNALLDVTDELTVLAWIRPTALPTGGNLKTVISKDNNYEFHLDSAGRIYWWWGGGALELRTTGTVPLNAWTHVAIVYSRAGAFQRVYFNGVQDPTTNNQNAALPTNNLPFQIGGDQGFAGREFAGLVDEVYVFRSALSAGRIAQYMNTTRACASTIDHFSFSHAGSGVGCVDQPITLTAHDATHTAVDANALMVNLSTSNLQGTWTGIQAGGGVLNDPVAGDGAATYTFAVGSNSVTLLFRYADLGTPTETFNFNVSGGGFTESTGTANASDDPPFTMAQAGFRFRNVEDANEIIPLQISGKPSNTGFNARTLRLQAINTNTSNGSCTNLFASQTQTVELGGECNTPGTCAARQVSINATNIATSNDNGGAGAAAYTGLSLNFNASSESDVVVVYPDAGEISLHARYDLNPLVAGFEMIGSSNDFIERPFGIAFRGANAATPVQHGTLATSALLGAAGDNFTMTLAGYQWAAGEDANNDGFPDFGPADTTDITDNGDTPNFAWDTVLGVAANLPGVALGTLDRASGGSTAIAAEFAAGAATVNNWRYSEAGNAEFFALTSNYLAPGVTIFGLSGYDGTGRAAGHVGRFSPKRFRLIGAPALTPRFGAACAPPSTFAYMDEPMRLAGFRMEAINTQNGRTLNYDGAYALHVPNPVGGAKAGFLIGARSGATDHTARISATHVLVPVWTQGLLEAPGAVPLQISLSFDRNVSNTPDGPYAATSFGIAPTDSDNVRLPAYDLDVDNDATDDHLLAGTTDVRFGRLVMQSIYGPNNRNLSVTLETQYWSGAQFTRNSEDDCTTFQQSDFALAFASPAPPPPNLIACETAMLEASITFASGSATLTMAQPGAGNSGTVGLTANLDAAGGNYCPSVGAGEIAASNAAKGYLRGRWDGGAAYDDKPSATVGFGLYGSQPKNFIFFRENY